MVAKAMSEGPEIDNDLLSKVRLWQVMNVWMISALELFIHLKENHFSLENNIVESSELVI